METAWSNDAICQHILNANFPPLSESDHFYPLKRCVDKVLHRSKNVIDLGCCKAEFSDAFPSLDYSGADLPHIINNVSKRLRPQNKYISLDATKTSLEIVSSFDIILMNSFLSEMPDPLRTLHAVLTYAKKYIIIHRQDIVKEDTALELYNTYGGLQTVNSLINIEDLKTALELNRCKIDMELNSYSDSNTKKTLLISKND